MTPSNDDGVEEIVGKESESGEEPNAKQLPDSNAKLAQENAELKDHLYEERLLWCISFFMAFDVFVFTLMPSWGGPIAILILQIIAILMLAKRYGVEEIHNLLNKVLYWGSSRKPRQKSKKHGKTGEDSAKT